MRWSRRSEDEPTALSKCGQHIPAELERIVNKALRKYPDERYQSARDLELDLKSLKRRLEFEAEARRSGVRTAVEDEVRPEAPGQEPRSAIPPASSRHRRHGEQDRSTSVVRQMANQISRPRGRLTLAGWHCLPWLEPAGGSTVWLPGLVRPTHQTAPAAAPAARL